MKSRGLLYLTILLTLFFFSCREDDDWDNTVFIADDVYPSLPAYSEMGYNSFGAKYGNDYFRVASSIVPCQIASFENGKMRFTLSGMHGDSFFSDSNMKLSFFFSVDDLVRDYQNLALLDGREIDLTDGSCQVVFSDGDRMLESVNVEKGRLSFSRVQIVSIDGKMTTAILSGRFELKFYDNDVIVNLSNGRFDLCVDDDNFYCKK